jgi:hypothetical protein
MILNACYLYDHLDKDQLEIDTIIFSGRFAGCRQSFDEFTISKNGMDAVMFDPTEKIYSCSNLIQKNILALRGSFRPVTKVNMDMYEKSLKMFLEENKVEKRKHMF